jgi:hypothetical protein
MNKRGRRSVRARAALFWGVATFVLLQIILQLVLTWARPDIADPVFGARAALLRHLLQREPYTSRELVLMLGSSRTSYGLDAARVETDLTQSLGRPVTVFNFGTLGAGPITELLHLQRLLVTGIRPKLLLIEVLPPALAGQLPVPVEARWWPARNHLDAHDLALLQHYGYPADELRRTEQSRWTLPAYTHRAALLSRLLPRWLPYGERIDWAWNGDDHGWTAQPKVLSAQWHDVCVRLDRQNYAAALTGFQIRGAPVQALRDLLETCRQRCIPTVLVLMPEGSEFRRWYPPDAQTQVNALLDNLCRCYGVPAIDARDWAADEDFFDAHHLRAPGATAFSLRLSRDLVRWFRHAD